MSVVVGALRGIAGTVDEGGIREYKSKEEFATYHLVRDMSNGQSVDSLASFNTHAADLGNAEFAKDYISRGWDYLGVSGAYHPYQKNKNLTVKYGYKHFIGGLLQRKIEQYYTWEAPRTITRLNQVSGLSLSTSYDFKGEYWLDVFSVGIETGTDSPFRYNTVTAEIGIAPFRDFFGVPFVFTARTGYNSDLAQYYKHTTSIGAALNFKTFR